MFWMLLIGCSVAEAEEVAAIMLATGDASLIRNGVAEPAAVGAVIGLDDVLHTGADGAIIVHLRNDHLVRVDSDLDLPVSDIVMLNAPQSDVEPGKQLADFLYPEEEAAFGGLANRAERVAGWHSRLKAADSMSGAQSGPPPKTSQTDSESEKAKEGKGSRGLEAAPAPPVIEELNYGSATESEPIAEERKERKPRLGAAKPKPKPRPATSSAPPAPSAAPPAPPADGAAGGGRPYAIGGQPEPTAPGGALPMSPRKSQDGDGRVEPESDSALRSADLQAAFAKGGSQRQCLLDWVGDLGVEVSHITIEVRMRDGVIHRIVGGGGLRLPDCIRDAFEGKAVSDVTDRLSIEVEIQ